MLIKIPEYCPRCSGNWKIYQALGKVGVVCRTCRLVIARDFWEADVLLTMGRGIKAAKKPKKRLGVKV